MALRQRLIAALAGGLARAERQALARELDPAAEQARAAAEASLASIAERVQTAESDSRLAAERKTELEAALQGAAKEKAALQQELMAVRAEATARVRAEHHPIYGKLLHDFGYKQVYASEPKRLVDKVILPVWKKQRIFRPERAKAIAKFKTQDSRFGFPGVISVYDLNEPGKRGIVDGQHRIGGLEILLNSSEWAKDKLILTEVYKVADADKQVADLFLEINKAEPAFEVDLPGVAADHVRAVIDNVSESLATQFPEMFKPSIRCRPPHLNVDRLRQDLFSSDTVRKQIDKASRDPEEASKELLNWALNQNDKLSKRSAADWAGSAMLRVKSEDALDKALAKCDANRFYLGIDLSWL